MATAGSITVDLLARTGSFQTDIDRAGKELERLSKRAAAASAGIDKQVASLELQAANYGKSTREATLYELALRGASVTQLRAAESALAQVEAQQKLAAASTLAKQAILAVGAAVVGLAIGGAVAFNELAKGAGKFQDLSEETGTSAENLASFALAAAGAGVGMDSIAGASIKLTKNLVGVDDESKAAGAALAAIGISISDFKKLDPADQYEQVGKALAGFADGAGKTAVAVALFGKAGAEQLKVFKQLEEQGGRQNILTAEQIALSDAYGDAQAISQKKLELYAEAIAAQAIPALTGLQGVLIDLAKELLNTGGTADKLGQNKSVLEWAQEAALAVAAFVDSLRVTGSEITAFVASTKTEFANLKILTASPLDIVKYVNDGTGPLAEALADRNKVAAAADKAYADNANVNATKIQDALRKQFAAGNAAAANPASYSNEGRAPTKPQLSFAGAVKPARGGSRDDPTKKLLDNSLKAIGDQIRGEQELLADRNKFLNLYNDQGLLSIKSYYDAQRTILEAATSAQAGEYDKQIALLKTFQATTPKEKDKAEAQGKINDILAKQAKLQQDAGQKGIELTISQEQAQKRLAAEFDQVNAQVLELQGNLTAAAAIKFDASFLKLKTTFTAEGNDAGLKAIQILRDQAIAQADLNKFASDYALIQGRAQIAEDRIALAVQTGQISGIEGMQRTKVERQKEIDLLETKLATLEKIDVASRTDAQVLQVEQYRLALEKLKATLDPLALQLNGIFEDAFGNAFTDFITGSKSAKDAFSDFSKSVLREISSLAAKDIAKSIFGGDGGVGGLLSGLIGGGKGGGFGSSGGGAGGLLGSLFGSGNNNIFGSIGSLFGGGSGLAIDTAGIGINAAGHGFSAAADSGLANVLDEDLASFFFDKGGYTGDVGVKQPAGIVHGGEFVFSAPAVRTLGLQQLVDAHHAARSGRVSLPGYESGGFVGRMPAANADRFRPRSAGMPAPEFRGTGTDGRPGFTANNYFTINGPVTRESQQQLAAAAAKGNKRALSRAG